MYMRAVFYLGWDGNSGTRVTLPPCKQAPQNTKNRPPAKIYPQKFSTWVACVHWQAFDRSLFFGGGGGGGREGLWRRIEGLWLPFFAFWPFFSFKAHQQRLFPFVRVSQRASSRNVSLRWLTYLINFINSVDNTNFHILLPYRRSTTGFSL